jgi:hypothetical protein
LRGNSFFCKAKSFPSALLSLRGALVARQSADMKCFANTNSQTNPNSNQRNKKAKEAYFASLLFLSRYAFLYLL